MAPLERIDLVGEPLGCGHLAPEAHHVGLLQLEEPVAGGHQPLAAAVRQLQRERGRRLPVQSQRLLEALPGGLVQRAREFHAGFDQRDRLAQTGARPHNLQLAVEQHEQVGATLDQCELENLQQRREPLDENNGVSEGCKR